MLTVVTERRTAWVLQHVAAEGPAGLGVALEAAGFLPRVIRIDRGEDVPAHPECDVLAILGGPMGVYEATQHPHLAHELRLVERALAAGRPVLGICLGSQLLATALGATVRPSGGLELGWLPVDVASAGAPWLGDEPLIALHWHGDVFDPPPGSVALASSSATACQAFAHGRALGMLFHLEADLAQVRGMAAAFPEDLRRAGLDAQALVDATAQHVDAAHRRLRQVVATWARG